MTKAKKQAVSTETDVPPETEKGPIASYGLNPKAGTSHLTQGAPFGGDVPPETDKHSQTGS